MPTVNSPLRYPGGKTVLSGLIEGVLTENKMLGCDYVEPFAGGAGVAWNLLFEDKVGRVILNDFDRSVWAFWKCVLDDTEKLCERVRRATFTIGEWKKQRAVQDNPSASVDDLGFSTLYMNRTNFSGIIRGGVIGGKDQSGTNRMDCRFNAEQLIRKIKAIAALKDRISICRMDALKFLERKLSKHISAKSLVYLDPPYYSRNMGAQLYLNAFPPSKHELLSQVILGLEQRWIMTYDCSLEINQIYASRERKPFRLSYSANRKRKGVEILLWDERLKIPDSSPFFQ